MRRRSRRGLYVRRPTWLSGHLCQSAEPFTRTTHPLATNSNRSQPNQSTVPAMEPEPKRIAQRR
jgi:hypothetical protein